MGLCAPKSANHCLEAASVDAEKLARVVIASLEGALLISRLEKDESPLREVRQPLDGYLEQNVRAKRLGAHP